MKQNEMKQTLILSMLAGLVVSSSVAVAKDETDTAEVSTETRERNRADDRKDRGDNDKRHGGRKNNDLSDRALRIIDTDEDGQVSVDEYMAHAQQRFEDMDINGNNFVTSQEMKEAAAIMREKHKEARSELTKRKVTSDTE